uniref:Uncharacterized protein n=1 Tax=Cacopsylla melanoneura TaxID=428564 RepID=A0A8D9EFQ2_9HEMI
MWLSLALMLSPPRLSLKFSFSILVLLVTRKRLNKRSDPHIKRQKAIKMIIKSKNIVCIQMKFPPPVRLLRTMKKRQPLNKKSLKSKTFLLNEIFQVPLTIKKS